MYSHLVFHKFCKYKLQAESLQESTTPGHEVEQAIEYIILEPGLLAQELSCTFVTLRNLCYIIS